MQLSTRVVQSISPSHKVNKIKVCVEKESEKEREREREREREMKLEMTLFIPHPQMFQT